METAEPRPDLRTQAEGRGTGGGRGGGMRRERADWMGQGGGLRVEA